jgi:hypothetical protein
MRTLRRAALPALAALALSSCALDGITAREVMLGDMPCSGIDPSTGAWVSHPLPVSTSEEDMGDAGTSGVCGWLRFQKREQLTIAHDLGRTPSVVLVYLAFRESGVGGTLASGDLARIMAVDVDEVVLENRTDESFFLRLVVE